MREATHTCPGYGCQALVPATRLMCPGCWGKVPNPLQREVYAAWNDGRGRGTLRHRAAITAAIEAVNP